MDNISVFGTEDSRFKSWRGHKKMRQLIAGRQKSISVLFLAMIFLFSAAPVLAICEGPLVPCGGDNPCQFCHIFVLIANIVNYVLTCLVPIIAGLMIIIGGLYLLAAGASPETLGKAKSVITATVIGLVIIFLAWVFLNTVLDFMGIAEWTGLGTWWEFTDKCPVR